MALLLVACGSASGAKAYNVSDSFDEIHKQLSDGRTVTCLVNLNGYGDSITCDWARAK